MWRGTRSVLGWSGVVAGIAALAVGAVYAVNVAGLGAKPGGFDSQLDSGQKIARPLLTGPIDSATTTTPPVTPLEEAEAPAALSSSGGFPMPWVDPEWIAQVAAATGIPERAMNAYIAAHLAVAAELPDCGLDWTTVAAIGSIESNHGRYGGATLGDDGYPTKRIVGVPLDGNGVAAIADTDGGEFDGDTVWDRAVGPMQFIPSTWARWANDGNADGLADPNQIDDAAQATARYLCASGPMTSVEGWRAAVFSYNHLDSYVDKVASVANEYAAASDIGG
ncbi:lytic transglycosylase domain-containing protein [Agromyces mariniharenae]|uniref:Lytic transglycosylase domain-containing protein n=2 Tax=Agromyces mariniharenae TaxID=2604423 RepID=A0A5S4V976_9MICO|nr:lytic transglycosylase domain-containing protein [Agromyces mariniharenae]